MEPLVTLEITRVSRLIAKVQVNSDLSSPALEMMLRIGKARIQRDPTADRWGMIVSDDAQPKQLATIIEAEEECGNERYPEYRIAGRLEGEKLQ